MLAIAYSSVFLPLLIAAPAWHTTEPCVVQMPQAIVMECQSGGYYSGAYQLSDGLHVEVDVLASSLSGDGRFWASVALNSGVKADNRYASVGIEQGIAPYWGDTQAYAVHLSTPASRCCDRLAVIDPASWHHLSIDYTPGQARYNIDGHTTSVAIDLGDTAVVELLCVAVDPGESSATNIARCEYHNVVLSQSTSQVDSRWQAGTQGLWQP